MNINLYVIILYVINNCREFVLCLHTNKIFYINIKPIPGMNAHARSSTSGYEHDARFTLSGHDGNSRLSPGFAGLTHRTMQFSNARTVS